MSECCGAEELIKQMEDDEPETVPVDIHVPEETAQKAKWMCKYREAQGREVEIQDLLLAEMSLDTTFRVCGEPVCDWMD